MRKARNNKKPRNHFFETSNQLLFFLLILLLPTQLGKHFFFPFSYLSGVRVDYLSPTLYLIDVVIFFLAALNIKAVLDFFKKKAVIFFGALLVINIIFSQSYPLALYGSLRIIEFMIILSLGRKLLSYLPEKIIMLGFLSGAVVELFLSLSQFVLKHAIQGPFYFIGERLFDLATPGISKTAINGLEFLRPYGTFSHPNSMAGFYLLLYYFVLTNKKFNKYLLPKYLSLLLFTCLIFISFSKIAILTFLGLNLLYFVINFKSVCRICVISRQAILFIIGFIFLNSSGDPLTGEKRLELIGQSITIIKSHPIFGVGLNNYLVAQSNFISKFPLFFNQPVHNIFLLWIGETGLITTGFLLFLGIKSFMKKSKNVPWFLLLVIFTTGLFDHYWLTLIQNFVLMGVIFSISLQDRVLPRRSKN
jgi:hypothetical protein